VIAKKFMSVCFDSHKKSSNLLVSFDGGLAEYDSLGKSEFVTR